MGVSARSGLVLRIGRAVGKLSPLDSRRALLPQLAEPTLTRRQSFRIVCVQQSSCHAATPSPIRASEPCGCPAPSRGSRTPAPRAATVGGEGDPAPVSPALRHYHEVAQHREGGDPPRKRRWKASTTGYGGFERPVFLVFLGGGSLGGGSAQELLLTEEEDVSAVASLPVPRVRFFPHWRLPLSALEFLKAVRSRWKG